MTEEIINKISSCQDDFDPDSITPDQALEKIFSSLNSVNDKESLPIRETLGRVLAEDIHSEINVPSGRNSAMDGYAVNSNDIPEQGVTSLTIIGSSFAGSPYRDSLSNGQCVRIMTGAIMPNGTDTVIIQEDVEASDNTIRIDHRTPAGSNVREAGEDLAIGNQVLAKGIKLSPADLGLLASLGIAEVNVIRKLKAAFFSTGDELRSIGEKLEDGMIYDSNRYTLHGMLSRAGVDITDMGIVRDDRELMQQAFQQAKDSVDVLITSGGVSVGEADFVKETLEQQGEVSFWKVAMKPGRPLTFGHVGSTIFFGLPGNPVSVMVTFYQFVQPALRKLSGENQALPVMLKVPCLSKLRKRPGRVEYQRGILEADKHGRMTVRKTGAQGSGILRSMAAANCFIVLPIDNDGVQPEDMVDVQAFYGIM